MACLGCHAFVAGTRVHGPTPLLGQAVTGGVTKSPRARRSRPYQQPVKPSVPSRAGVQRALIPSTADPQGPVISPMRLTTMITKLAEARQLPDAAWMDMYWAASLQALPSFSVEELALVVCSLGILGEEPPEDWVLGLWEALQLSQMAAAAGEATPATATAVAQLLWGCSCLGLVPDRALAAGLLRQASHSLASLTPEAAADLAWAVASLGYRPSKAWLDALCTATLQLGLEFFEPPQLSKMVWALATWAYIPPDAWLESFSQAAVAHMDYTAQAATAILWGFAAFKVLPDPLWVRWFFGLTMGQLGQVPADGLVNCLWAVAAMENAQEEGSDSYHPVEGWFEEWQVAVAEQLPDLDRPSVVKLYWALAQLKLQPPDSWLQLLVERTQELLETNCLEPFELVYLTRHCSAVLAGSVGQGRQDVSTRPLWVQQCLRDVFKAMQDAKLPPEWVRLNMKFPPYGVPDAEEQQDQEAGAG